MKFKLLIIILLCSLELSAEGVWTVRSVPNTRLESDFIHVSDPDDILSDSCEQLINTSLHSIRDKADVFIVALNSIGEASIESFANELFNLWGIGDAETNNGVLLLLAKEQRELKFEVGYGAEATMTDAKCQEIFLDYIVPFFKEGDYQSGICSGVNQILTVYGAEIPAGLVTTLPTSYENDYENEDGDDVVMISIIALLYLLFPLFALISLLINSKKGAKVSTSSGYTEIDGVMYVDKNARPWSGDAWEGAGCLKAILFGFSFLIISVLVYSAMDMMKSDESDSVHSGLVLFFSILAYLTWICIRQNLRALRVANKKARTSNNPKEIYQQAYNNYRTKTTRTLAIWVGWIFDRLFKKKIENAPTCLCAACHSEMKPFSMFSFSEVQKKEQEIKSVKYKPYICTYGHVTVFKDKLSSAFRLCSNCNGITERKIKSQVIKKSTYTEEGLKETEYRCEFCGATHTDQEK
nr:TPM domain-containing protein [Bacteroidales bacterium]